MAALGIESADVPDWTCCGSTPAHTVDHHLAGALAARNLTQARKAGFTRVATPCPSCLSALRTADARLAEPAYKAEVERLLGHPAPEHVDAVSTMARLAAFDMDGTLLMPDHRLGEKTLSTLKRLHACRAH